MQELNTKSCDKNKSWRKDEEIRKPGNESNFIFASIALLP
jgi:hypothetical protein